LECKYNNRAGEKGLGKRKAGKQARTDIADSLQFELLAVRKYQNKMLNFKNENKRCA